MRVGERYAQLRLAAPVVAARGDRVILRGETTLGGGPCSIRRRRAIATSSAWRSSSAARSRRRSTPRCASTRFAIVLDGELDGVERAGPWVFSAEWLARLEAELRARLAAADPLDPGIAPPSEPWAADVLPLLAARAARREALPARRDGRRSAAARPRRPTLERELAAAGVRATKVDDDELARFLEAKRAARAAR